MTEHELHNKLREPLMKLGIPIRLENGAALSVPDMAFITEGTTIWIEYKIVHSGKITIPKFQFALGVKMAKELDDDLFWIFAWNKDHLIGIKYIEILPHVKANAGINEFNIDDVPYHRLDDLVLWQRLIIWRDYA
jgi:hypothetical protein